MLTITAGEIAAAVGGCLYGEGEVTSVSTDSRQIEENCLFVPLVGERFDGHAYIASALEKGAAGCLCAVLPERRLEGKFYVEVSDTRLALKALAGWYREKFAIPFVQITGSVGKTTTKEMVAAVLAERFATHATRGNFNNDIGVPLTLFGLEAHHEAAVIESGMNHFGEIRYLGEMVRPNFAIISNVGDAHIEFLGSRAGILQAKSEIFEHLKADGIAVLNGDDELLNTLCLPFETVRCGLGENCDVLVSNVMDNGVKGITCTVKTKKTTYDLRIPALGRHMIYPASMAIAVGERLGMTKEEIERGVAAYRPSGSRMHVIECERGRIVLDDCYNANPQSMAAALEILSKEEKTVAILGDMGELGALTQQAHREIGEMAKKLGVNKLIAVGEKSRDMAEGAKGMDVLWFATVEECIANMPDYVYESGAVVEVKASHAMHFERIVAHITGEKKD